ncbi:hypothetical protein F4560_006730 [Saccharothrix ecbatanensis]|uniref:Galactan 5-O-arabinofuranosyltransferase n=1 Tax=Saccharothrix ecbatanensis TaxID=1105145 RepID=A0A7W9HR60_9PSEU|nr:DUF6541 family protein [Saccharothrix ecbatanensis]MBB5806962.1 hypothetical protein [Saccharothrix ecbatanensis]
MTAALLVLVLLWVPGLLAGAAIRLRGWTLAAAAPALTYGLVSIGGLLLGKLGFSWTLVTFGAWTLLASALLLLVTTLVQRRWPAHVEDDHKVSRNGHLVVGAGLAIGLAVGAVTFMRGIGTMNRLAQDWDAPHHGNLVRWFAEHQASLVSSAGVISNQPENTSYFYPATYHQLLSLLLDKVGITLPEVLNAGALSTVLIWPVGIAAMGLAWKLPARVVAFAAAVSTWFSPFPYDSLWRGPLWPYVAGIALLPAILALVAYLVRPRGVTGPLAFALAVAAVVGLQPSLAFIVAGLVGIVFLACVFRLEPIDWKRAWPTLVGTVVLGGLAAVPLMLPSMGAATGVAAMVWPSEATPAGAFGQMLTFSGVAAFPQWWIGLPALLGMVVMVKRGQMLWMVGVWLAFGGLYAATVSLEGRVVQKLTGVFYNDHWRLAVLLPLPGAIGFGVAVVAVGTWLVNRYRDRLPALAGKPWASVAVSVAFFLLVTLLSGAYVDRNSARLAQAYNDGPVVSEAEQAAYRWLGERVKPGERVLNDVFDGSAWLYAVAEVEPVEWTFYGTPEGTPNNYLVRNLNKINTDPEVRADLNELKVRYVIIGKGYVRLEKSLTPGLANLDAIRGFRQVFKNEGATIYEIEGQEHVAESAGAAGNR